MVGNQLNLSQMLKEADRRINYDFEEFEDEDYVEDEEYFEDVGDREYFNVHDSGDGFSEDVMDLQQDKRTQVAQVSENSRSRDFSTRVSFIFLARPREMIF